jgi:hypothetical protein
MKIKSGMTQMSVPKVHMQRINSSFAKTHGSASSKITEPRGMFKEQKTPLMKPHMPGKNPGIGRKFSV